MFPMLEDREKRTRKLVLLALFTICYSLCMVLSAFTTVDIAVLQAAILMVLGLNLLAISWAAKRGYDYDSSDTFAALLTSIIIGPLVYTIAVIPFPLKMVGIAICGFLITLVCSSFVVAVCDDLDDKDGVRRLQYGGDSDDDDSGSFGEQRV